MNIVSITAINSNWFSLSSVYTLDSNILMHASPMTTLDGYTGVVQEIYNNPFDQAINRNTIVQLPSSMKLLDFMYDKGKDIVKTGGYAKITVTIDDVIYYLALGDSDGSYLKLSVEEEDGIFIRVDVNDNNTLSFYYGINKLITVSEYEPLELYIDRPLVENKKYRQQFKYESFNNNQVTINTITPLPIRYWAYRTTGPNAFKIRANGYLGDVISTNNYLFNVEKIDETISYKPTGLIVGHNWVTYYNNVSNKANNKNVNIKDKTEIDIQHLIDNPYHQTTGQSTKINIANLKTIMTETYKYKE